ncbi:sulfur carrier protein ThiS [Motiliproteus sediminis]|uniref:sulfur carrier protein ThiS n=1 Tax=Motiliproteus sediminis TaxID=1468178 RepID=UPI0031B9B05F
MIKIELNGEPYEAEAGLTISALLVDLGLADKRVAVEYNLEILPKSEHPQTELRAADRVEIVHAIGGG